MANKFTSKSRKTLFLTIAYGNVYFSIADTLFYICLSVYLSVCLLTFVKSGDTYIRMSSQFFDILVKCTLIYLKCSYAFSLYLCNFYTWYNTIYLIKLRQIVKVSVNSQCQQSMSTNVSRSLLMVKGYIFILWFKPPSKVWYFKSILISYKKTRNKFQYRVRS